MLAPTSATVPHAWHSAQRPAQRSAEAPHSEQRKPGLRDPELRDPELRALGLVTDATLAAATDSPRDYSPAESVLSGRNELFGATESWTGTVSVRVPAWAKVKVIGIDSPT